MDNCGLSPPPEPGRVFVLSWLRRSNAAMDVWAQVLASVGKRVTPQCFETWFRPISFKGHDGKTLRLTVPSENFRTCLLGNYGPVLQEAIAEVLGDALSFDVSLDPPHAERASVAADCPNPASSPMLNSRYTFASFVVGASNQFAQAASLAVAEQPAKAYNPLYLYGGVGLGKTHLMHAIGHAILKRNSRLRLSYMSTEQFMNELVNSIRYDRTMQFREKYRNIDVLLMDDIQFIAGKERTQEEFFHTFNALYDAQKQIVITSDCPPKEIPTLEERLHSRFEWGLIADIQPPDLETKLAILKRKAEALFPSLPDAVSLYIAKGVRSNVRELEGALIRLSARASLDGLDFSEIDLPYTKEVLKNIVTEEARNVTSEMVMRAVAEYFGLKPNQLKTKNNARQIVEPRQIAMFVCKKTTRLSLPQIGKDFGGKHHTTVLHSIRKIESVLQHNPDLSAAVNKIIHNLG
ncbi:MAG TPA: chromosomal replication initiator protein DnaA [Acidobacteriota bacterium]|nr:chromosomal replication initiator protein DnaA [Acidobacteriota bacterium]